LNSLSDTIRVGNSAVRGEFRAVEASVAFSDLVNGATFFDRIGDLQDRAVLLATNDQLSTAIALIELDGLARRIVLCTPELTDEQLSSIAATAQTDAIVTHPSEKLLDRPFAIRSRMASRLLPGGGRWASDAATPTEWIVLTSGTTGMPKLVVHSLESLAGALPRASDDGITSVWSTFYDIRRYGGLQIYLRAVRSAASLVLSNPSEPLHEFMARAAAAGVTHISGTPTHWRRALMAGPPRNFAPRYVRLSGEIADQAVLDGLRAAFPTATIAHAFASTEVGVAFDVNDGQAGFPAAFIDDVHSHAATGIDLKVLDNTLRIRSRRSAVRYLGDASSPIMDSDGFVDTGDLVERLGDRYYFHGRQGGVINVGGLKVYPEEVEAVINADPRVRMSLVRARRNPITGAIVVADVMLADPQLLHDDPDGREQITMQLLKACRLSLPSHKVPTSLRLVDSLPLTPAGKLVRPNA
jgi:acyl-coenzyme A synthetase/AMP-(fatty) acid ligase